MPAIFDWVCKCAGGLFFLLAAHVLVPKDEVSRAEFQQVSTSGDGRAIFEYAIESNSEPALRFLRYVLTELKVDPNLCCTDPESLPLLILAARQGSVKVFASLAARWRGCECHE